MSTPQATTRTWTDAQLRAITARESALLVSAGAGSGKTSVLVERVIRRILDDGGDIDRLLIVTFTEAAAAEMKERIGRAIRKVAATHVNPAHAARQMHLLERSLITTLHSFCLQVIRRAGVDSPIGPGFRIADEQEAGMLREWVQDELLEACFGSQESAFVELVMRYGGNYGDRDIRRWILRLYQFARSQPEPERWLRESITSLRESVAGPLANAHFADAFFSALLQALYEADRWLVRAITVARQPGGPHGYEEVLTHDRERLVQAVHACANRDFERFRLALLTSFPKLKADRESDEQLRQSAQDCRNKAKNAVSSLVKGIASRSEEVLMAELATTTAHLTTLTELTLAFHSRYQEAKRVRGVVDFADLEHFAYQVLTDSDGQASAYAREWAARFDEIMVDEYQDTSPIQDAIISRIRQGGDCALFQVGDVKQSIYRFRMAEPGLFLHKYQTYAAGMEGQRVDLQENFRSRGEIVDAVNVIFSQLFSPLFGGLSYDEGARMQQGALYPLLQDGRMTTVAAPVEIVLIDRNPAQASVDDESDETEEQEEAVAEAQDAMQQENDAQALADVEALSATEQEARVIAQRLLAMMDGRHVVWHPEVGAYEPLAWQDVAVLLRANGGRVATMSRVFQQFGIPSVGGLDTADQDGYEMRLVSALMAVIDNPRQDIPLASVLASPIGGFTVEELARIRLSVDQGDFYRAVKACRRLAQERQASPLADDFADVPERLEAFWQRLEDWRTIARRQGAGETLAQVLSQSGLLTYTRALPGGAQRAAQLKRLIRQALAYDALEAGGLSGFASYLQKHQELGLEQGSGGAQARLNAVRIMTIHSSKGLEFPVVFVAALDKGMEPPAQDGALSLHRTLGFGPQVVDPVQRERYETVASLAVRQQERKERLAEEARVLYVALTRARERLILVASAGRLDTRLNEWKETAQLVGPWTSRGAEARAGNAPFPPAVLLAARSYLDWLMPVYYRAGADVSRVFSLAPRESAPSVSASSEPALRSMDVGAVARLVPGALQWNSHADERSARSATDVQISTRDWIADVWSPSASDLKPIAAKWSVTELKDALAQSPGDWELGDSDEATSPEAKVAAVAFRADHLTTRQPRFISSLASPTVSGAERGTTFHWLMEHLSLVPDLAQDGSVARQVASLCERGWMKALQVDADIVRAVQRFFQSQLGRLLLDPQARVLREAPFTMALPANLALTELLGEDSESVTGDDADNILVQGTLDCLVILPDACLLLDFKTDRIVGEHGLQEAVARYRPQLALYEMAAQRALKRPITQKVLYFVDGERAVTL